MEGETFLLNAALIMAAALGAPEQPLYTFDMQAELERHEGDSVLQYDLLKFTAALQGLANRDAPRLWLRFLEGAGQDGTINIDDYWLDHFQEGWLEDTPIVALDSLEALFAEFEEHLTGAVVWDPAVPATSNVAATVCGVEGWLPVRADSALYEKVVENGPELPVERSLVDKFDGSESTSPKCDAYLWAMREYLEQGETHSALMGQYVDAYTQQPDEPGFHYNDLDNAVVANQDYYIANRAFIWDLSPWPDEAPVDDPDQEPGTDRETLETLLRAQYEQNQGETFTRIGGFAPWNLKYTTHAGGANEPVPTEWEFAALFSAYNAGKDADALGLAGMSNASVFMHHPLRDEYEQNPRPEPVPLEDKTYVLIYMGDYDSAAWLSRHIPSIWDDPVRGDLPMAWAFNPGLSDRAPHVFDHIFRTKTEHDWFIAGDSGASYVNPSLLIGDRLGSGLPDALDTWVEYNKPYFDQFDYSITGFVIDGNAGFTPLEVQEAYTEFSPDGVGMQLDFDEPLVNGTPFLRHARDIYPTMGNLETIAGQMAAHAEEDKPQFLIFRCILVRPSVIEALRGVLKERHPEHNWVFSDPYTFFDLYRRHLTGSSPEHSTP